MRVPDEFALQLGELDVLSIEFPHDFGAPKLREARKTCREVDRVHHTGVLAFACWGKFLEPPEFTSSALKVMLGPTSRGHVPATNCMQSLKFASILLLTLGASTGCTHTHQVRPLGKGNASVHASLGGPLVRLFDTVLPIPIVSVGGAYGVTERVEVLGHVDLMGAAFGSFHYDMGVAWHPMVSDQGFKPTLTLGAGAHVLATSESVLVAPTANVASAWRLARKHLVYVGLDAALPMRDSATFVAGPLLGAELRLGKRFGLALETKYLAPWYDTKPNPPKWVSPGGFGFVSVLLGANIYLGDVQ